MTQLYTGTTKQPRHDKTITRHQRGFTIVELLIVIVVIAILAAISIVAYNGVQERARASQASSELRDLAQAITMARESSGKTLMQITGSNCTRCYPDAYTTSISRIASAAGVDLSHVADGDPWGNSYSLDENEGENGGCSRDSITIQNQANHPSVTIPTIPLGGYSGCL
ncbi:type IV pilin protein [Flaviflexus salsibiostraticola]|nr:type II secretion system protein [Flaviflexus salsibiostraticola]